MSVVLELSEEKLAEIIPLLEKFEKKIKAAEPIFKIEGRRLEEVARTLPQYQASYNQTFQEVKAIEAWVLNIKEKKVGKLWKKYTEGYSRQLSAKDIQMYIAADQEIVDLNQILIEIVHVKDSFDAIVDALRQMGWMVGNMTKLRVAELDQAVL